MFNILLKTRLSQGQPEVFYSQTSLDTMYLPWWCSRRSSLHPPPSPACCWVSLSLVWSLLTEIKWLTQPVKIFDIFSLKSSLVALLGRLFSWTMKCCPVNVDVFVSRSTHTSLPCLYPYNHQQFYIWDSGHSDFSLSGKCSCSILTHHFVLSRVHLALQNEPAASDMSLTAETQYYHLHLSLISFTLSNVWATFELFSAWTTLEMTTFIHVLKHCVNWTISPTHFLLYWRHHLIELFILVHMSYECVLEAEGQT